MSALSCKGQQEGRGGRRLAAGSVWFSNTGNHQPCPVLVECAERSRPEGVLVGVAGQRAFWTLLVFLGLARPLFRAPGASKFRRGPQRLGNELRTFCFSLVSPRFLEGGEAEDLPPSPGGGRGGSGRLGVHPLPHSRDWEQNHPLCWKP